LDKASIGGVEVQIVKRAVFFCDTGVHGGGFCILKIDVGLGSPKSDGGLQFKHITRAFSGIDFNIEIHRAYYIKFLKYFYMLELNSYSLAKASFFFKGKSPLFKQKGF